jgi:adenosylcobinamide-GDP ribazoletransferase
VDEIKAAIGFLTRVPTASSSGARTGAAAFAIVGGLIGLVGAVPLLLIGTRASLAAGGLAIGAIALVSGGLHLDGLADTADALAAPTAEAATRARKDPRVGAAGATAIAIAVVVDAALLGALVGGVGRVAAAVGCVAAAAGSRAVPPLVAVVLLRRTRGESRAERTGGAGAWFAQRASPRTAIAAGASAAAIGIVGALVAGGPAVLFGVLLGMVVGTGVAGWLAVVRGRVDGDGYGAIVEVTFAAILLTTVLAT